MPYRPADAASGRLLLVQPQLTGEKAWTWTRSVASAIATTRLNSAYDNLVPEDTYLLLILYGTYSWYLTSSSVSRTSVSGLAVALLPVASSTDATLWRWATCPEIQTSFPAMRHEARWLGRRDLVRFSLDHGGKKSAGYRQSKPAHHVLVSRYCWLSSSYCSEDHGRVIQIA